MLLMATGGGGTHRDSPIGNVFPKSWMCPRDREGLGDTAQDNGDSPHRAVVEPGPTGTHCCRTPLLTHPWEVFEVLDLCGNVTVRACGQRAGAPTVLHRQPQKGFAQIYSKVQPWEVK